MGSLKDYDILNKIGQGSFGSVYRCRRKAGKEEYVLKQINLNKLQFKSRQYAVAEGKLLKEIKSRYIVAVYDSFTEKNMFNLVLEYCGGGDLNKYLLEQKLPLQQNQIWKFFIQMVIGLADIHMKKILHRDIKTQNIFLTKNKQIRIGDLGVAKKMNNDLARTIVGTPYYLSPQMCEEKPYNEKTDIWALGCILYELCTGKHPFEANNQATLALKIVIGSYKPIPSCYSNDLSEILHQCLVTDYKLRPTARHILAKQIIQQKICQLNIQTEPLRKESKIKSGMKPSKSSSKLETAPKTKKWQPNASKPKPSSQKVQSNKVQITKVPSKQDLKTNKVNKPIDQIKSKAPPINKNNQIQHQLFNNNQPSLHIISEQIPILKQQHSKTIIKDLPTFISKQPISSIPIIHVFDENQIYQQLDDNQPFQDESITQSDNSDQQQFQQTQINQLQSLSAKIQSNLLKQQQLNTIIKSKQQIILKILSQQQYQQIKKIAFEGNDSQIQKVMNSKKLLQNPNLLASLYKVLQCETQIKDCKARGSKLQQQIQYKK